MKTESVKQIQSVGSKNKLNNYSQGRTSFEVSKKGLVSKRSYKNNPQQFHPRDKAQSAFMDESAQDDSLSNASSFNKKHKVGQYYHNAKALENVLKQDKEALQKREVNKQKILDRKQKVASYSKLVREIHWDEKKKPESYEIQAIKKRALKNNKLKKRLTDHQVSLQEQGEMTENLNEANHARNQHKIHNIKSQNKSIQGLQHQDHGIYDNFPQSNKNQDSHNFVGEARPSGGQKSTKSSRINQLRSLREKRDSPSVNVKPFSLDNQDDPFVDQTNMLNELNISGIDRDDSRDSMMGRNQPGEYINSGKVNDEIIEDIQKRLELLDEFK